MSRILGAEDWPILLWLNDPQNAVNESGWEISCMGKCIIRPGERYHREVELRADGGWEYTGENVCTDCWPSDPNVVEEK